MNDCANPKGPPLLKAEALLLYFLLEFLLILLEVTNYLNSERFLCRPCIKDSIIIRVMLMICKNRIVK